MHIRRYEYAFGLYYKHCASGCVSSGIFHTARNKAVNVLINKIKNYLKTLGFQDYLINIALNNITLDNTHEDEKLKKDYEKLYNKYKNKYDKNKLNYILIGKLYQKGYELDKVKTLVTTSNS